jgi:transcriptional regulator with XRE-family HTH domain
LVWSLLNVNALQEFIRAEMTARGWTQQADLVRASGLSPQHVSKMLSPGQQVRQMPDDATIAGLHAAFGTDEVAIRRIALSAMGIDLAPLSITRTVSDVSDDELLAELGRRLQVARKTDQPRLVRPLAAAARRREGPRSKRG